MFCDIFALNDNRLHATSWQGAQPKCWTDQPISTFFPRKGSYACQRVILRARPSSLLPAVRQIQTKLVREWETSKNAQKTTNMYNNNKPWIAILENQPGLFKIELDIEQFLQSTKLSIVVVCGVCI